MPSLSPLFFLILALFLIAEAGGIVISDGETELAGGAEEPPITAPLHVDGEPAGMIISIDGTPAGTVNENGVLDLEGVPVGDHLVHAALEGYIPQDIPVMVGEGLPTLIRITLLPETTGTIRVSSVPDRVQVFLDDNYRGITPLALDDIQTGDHSLILRLPGYQDWTSQVTVMGGEPSEVNGRLTKILDNSPVQTEQSPAGAGVLLSLVIALALVSLAGKQ
jgi:hypothetical protein